VSTLGDAYAMYCAPLLKATSAIINRLSSVVTSSTLRGHSHALRARVLRADCG
jgi:hypothetical protein